MRRAVMVPEQVYRAWFRQFAVEQERRQRAQRWSPQRLWLMAKMRR